MAYTYEINGRTKKFKTKEEAERYAYVCEGAKGVGRVKGSAKSAAKKAVGKVKKTEKVESEE